MAKELVWPPVIDATGRERTIEQGTLPEVQQGLDLALTVPNGCWPFDTDFGRPELAFTTDPERAMNAWLDNPDVQPRVGARRVTDDAGSFVVEVLSVNTYPESAS